jgi:hypothetical protein
MYVSPAAIGLGALALGIMLALFFPLGRARGNHLVSTLIIFALFAVACFLLLRGVLNSPWPLAIGVGLGLVVVLYRALRRWLRYFQGVVYRTTHPYYWFSRMWRGGTRSRRRRR